MIRFNGVLRHTWGWGGGGNLSFFAEFYFTRQVQMLACPPDVGGRHSSSILLSGYLRLGEVLYKLFHSVIDQFIKSLNNGTLYFPFDI